MVGRNGKDAESGVLADPLSYGAKAILIVTDTRQQTNRRYDGTVEAAILEAATTPAPPGPYEARLLGSLAAMAGSGRLAFRMKPRQIPRHCGTLGAPPAPCGQRMMASAASRVCVRREPGALPALDPASADLTLSQAT